MLTHSTYLVYGSKGICLPLSIPTPGGVSRARPNFVTITTELELEQDKLVKVFISGVSFISAVIFWGSWVPSHCRPAGARQLLRVLTRGLGSPKAQPL
ncbi:hypothetical protein FKM82_000736 [Ascaphus truei]